MSKMGKAAIAAVTTMSVLLSPATSVQAAQDDEWTLPVLGGDDFLWGIDPTVTNFGTTNLDTASWTSPGDGWTYLLGGDIKLKIEGNVLTITGEGELPDYNIDTITLRPWDGLSIDTVVIDEGITYIGSYSFYGMEKLKYINLGSKAFVNDSTCFEGISDNPTITVNGTDYTQKHFGPITLTSLDSIKRLQEDKVEISIKTANLPDTYAVTAHMGLQSNDCYEAYAAFIGDYNFATTFDMALTNGKELLGTTENKLQYTLDIPTEFVEEGRTFKILAIGSGYVFTYDDLDTNDATITFATDMPTTWYALIYK
jgi:hypothetical protein